MFKLLTGATRSEKHICPDCIRCLQRSSATNSRDVSFCTVSNSEVLDTVVTCSKFRSQGESNADASFSSIALTMDRDINGDLVWRDPRGKVVRTNGKNAARFKARVRRKQTGVNPSVASVN